MKTTLLICILILSTVCNAKENAKGPWISTKSGRVTLHCRPVNYSKSPSPDSLTITHILKEQNDCYYEIQNKLKLNDDFEFSIYLFNYDEAKEKIGTNGGGHANSKKRIIYYTYLYPPIKKAENGIHEYMGNHELVHIFAYRNFGRAKKIVREGYAVALSGDYSAYKAPNGEFYRKTLELWMKEFHQKNQVLTPTEMLDGGKIPHSKFYPQSGFFINWLFEQYGVEKVNLLYPKLKLYKLNESKLKKEFELVLGESFSVIENNYLEYCKLKK
jgi:hypothetical protein